MPRGRDESAHASRTRQECAYATQRGSHGNARMLLTIRGQSARVRVYVCPRVRDDGGGFYGYAGATCATARRVVTRAEHPGSTKQVSARVGGAKASPNRDQSELTKQRLRIDEAKTDAGTRQKTVAGTRQKTVRIRDKRRGGDERSAMPLRNIASTGGPALRFLLEV
ncbi:uncharacterized protein SCHCODRAFT_01305924 [Schizophyllum commune H4-8]|uniref:uncharacterized protein n=1 Tax=Schizophyllum commune (strain H4-8 / FGSC 9210) TaxID=578458 RepID=UPI00215EDC1C|nr:uncharacterized protein SCHCODRAFT_01305924 [Schizophyllum commune H4-8]KAI5890904.1 hypothetical protein SCHCODRAFT_01305924 [Schizophyllum commune H4-8]